MLSINMIIIGIYMVEISRMIMAMSDLDKKTFDQVINGLLTEENDQYGLIIARRTGDNLLVISQENLKSFIEGSIISQNSYGYMEFLKQLGVFIDQN